MTKHFLLIYLLIPSQSFSAGKLFLQPDSVCGKDATVWNAPGFPNGNTNYGSGDFLGAHAWTNSGTPDTSRSLIEFDLDQIASGSYIVEAHLSLYNNPNTVFAGGEHSTLSGLNSAYIRRIVQPWDESEVNWFTQPATTTLHQTSIPASSGPHDDYINIDVTQLVQDMVDSAATSFGFEIRLVREQFYRALVFASSDCANPGLRPKLIVSYEEPLIGCWTLQPHDGCGKDALVWNAPGFSNGTTNYGDVDGIGAHAWTNTGIPDTGRTLLDFDLSFIPSNVAVTSAYLSMWNNPNTAYAYGQSSSLSGPNTGLLRRITSPWDENSVNWFSRPSVSTQNSITVPGPVGAYGDLLNIDVTTLVQDMLQNPTTSFGFEFKLLNEAYYRAVVLGSSDCDDETKTPRLEICYSSTTGISEMKNNHLHLYPNPASDYFIIESSQPQGGSFVMSISDALGQLVYSKTCETKEALIREKVDISALNPGLYFIELKGKDRRESTKLVKY